MSNWRLLLTRPADESAAVAQVLTDAGIFSSSLPLLEIEPLRLDDAQRAKIFELMHFQAVIVVSKPAARLVLELLDEIWPQPPIQPWFCVGSGTGRILRDYGLTDVNWPEHGDDSEALFALPQLQNAINIPGSRVLIMRGEDGREWMAERLREQGVKVEYLSLYRRYLPDYPHAALSECVRAERLNGLVVSSGQGLEHLLRIAGKHWSALACLPLFVPSPRVAEMARAAGAQIVVDCRGASASALLAAVQARPEPAACQVN